MYLPFKPIKGQAFTLYLPMVEATTPPAITSYTYLGISKDGGQFTETTNAATFISTDASDTQGSRGRAFVVLTAAEMNADVIVVVSNNNGSANQCGNVVIYTTESELATAPTLNSSIADKVKAIFQYLLFKRTVTSTQEKLYKSDNSTVLATGTLSDDGTTFNKGLPS
jgi:hypothetical protein